MSQDKLSMDLKRDAIITSIRREAIAVGESSSREQSSIFRSRFLVNGGSQDFQQHFKTSINPVK